MTGSTALGEYLRARRALVDPADVGLTTAGVRRTPGLRREEVATLAGISADYYLRLEQGRDRNPSTQVLEALARVLRLDAAATQYLLGLPAARPPARRRARRDTVPVGIRLLLDTLTLPAFVENRRFDVIAANRLASAVSPAIRVGGNRVRAVLLDDAERDLWVDWEEVAASMVASLRTSIGTDDDPATAQLVGELSLASETFRQHWARHDVRALGGGVIRMRHPQVGDLELRREKLPIPDTAGQLLAIYHAEPGSPSAQALALLGTLAAAPT
ncbi:Helix-turn-helix domain-containing protein [Jatrophihabitans endophyticus]|uniref:Helix-turn-helix domain-containing protein n=1 Tax=Jatrophihabitans endophyticus TaxID=1206085 RepID=A0A1M5E308_9ACTN|nr:helix-turn-helix transcriptional regulator [Jatrophihabitans endophyticus]SHF73461.1 Helix-turn-helix domain-containing protein [Jatrophihabitans endophyticus]